jgi:hypothetical protein
MITKEVLCQSGEILVGAEWIATRHFMFCRESVPVDLFDALKNVEEAKKAFPHTTVKALEKSHIEKCFERLGSRSEDSDAISWKISRHVLADQYDGPDLIMFRNTDDHKKQVWLDRQYVEAFKIQMLFSSKLSVEVAYAHPWKNPRVIIMPTNLTEIVIEVTK